MSLYKSRELEREGWRRLSHQKLLGPTNVTWTSKPA